MTIASLPIPEEEFTALKQVYAKAEQDHVFRFFDELSSKERSDLVHQLKEINVEELNAIFKKSTQAHAKGDAEDSVKPLDDTVLESVRKASTATRESWEKLGLEKIAQGKVATILMAGGQGTRLGSSAPKGCYDLKLSSGKSLFQLQAERIRRLQDLATAFRTSDDPSPVVIPWYIMTSGPTHKHTYEFFKQHHFFGLDESNITFFEQGTLPCLTNEGKIILETKSKVAIAPNGNGGIYAAVQNQGVIADLKRRGVEYSHCYCVDNCLARVADPVFIGYCVSKSTDCGVKVVPKLSPDEPVGVVCERNGKYGVVEYSEISHELSHKKRGDELMFGAANIVNHFFSTAFLERVPTFASELEYHIARKKIKYVDLETGEQVTPKTNSGMKLECFVFDVFPYAQHFSVLEVERQDEFSPLKNAPGSGIDCPETSKRSILEQHVRFIEHAGGKVQGSDDLESLQLEISPLVSYRGEGLEQYVRGKTLSTPAVIETVQDLQARLVAHT